METTRKNDARHGHENDNTSYKGTMFCVGIVLAVIVATYLVLMFVFNART